MSPAPVKLTVSVASVDAAPGARTPLSTMSRLRDNKGASPTHHSSELILKRVFARANQENLQSFFCAHAGCIAVLFDLSGAYQHCFTCVPSPACPFPRCPRATSPF